MTYRFYLTVGSTITEVFPLNFLESSLVDEKERGQVFYRRKFNGVLTFVNNNGDDDFDLIYFIEQTDPCEELIFSITREGVAYWDGYFSTTDGKFDLDKCTFEVTPLSNDEYANLLENAEIKWNVLNLTPRVTTNAIWGINTLALTRNQRLIDVIEFLANKIKTGATVSSTFFTAATNPVTLNASHTNLLTIAQKSDIIRPTSTEPAKQLILSWNELMDILFGMFQVKWNYNSSTNTINVEHISWFDSVSAGLDLTNEPLAQGKNQYEYMKEKMPKYERFAFMEAGNTNFLDLAIFYSSKCVDPNPESQSIETRLNVTTDLEYIIFDSARISDEGIVILSNYLSGGSYYVEKSTAPLSSEVRLNSHLSWSMLHNAYFRHNRVLLSGYMNNVLTTFWTARKTIKQEVSAIVCPIDSFDPLDEITTELGTTYLGGVKAKVGRADLDPKGLMKFILEYGPGDNENTGVEDLIWYLITENGCGVFTIEFSEVTPAEYDIILTYIIYNSSGTPIYSGGSQTWTIPSGSSTDTYSTTFYETIPAGGWWEPNLDVAELSAWNGDIILDITCSEQ